MRMPWWPELRWLIASTLLHWVAKLTFREASSEMIVAFQKLGENFTNDPKFETVKMRLASRR